MSSWLSEDDSDFSPNSPNPSSSSSSPSKGIFKSSKTRKLLLRLTIWEIYSTIFLSKHSLYSNYTMNEKIDKSKEILVKLFHGQRNYQTKVDLIFPSDTPIEYWENVITNIRTFENELGSSPILELPEIILPKQLKKIKAFTSTDKPLDTTVNCFSDPFTLASELMIQHKLPSDELDYIHGMIQHEMVDLVRGAVQAQRESLRKIQYKIATVEHLTLLSETICTKYQQLKQSYESNSKKSIKGTAATSSSTTAAASTTPQKSSNQTSSTITTNRTSQHFNKLIIDERRKLEALEKKIKEAIKGLGRLEPHELYDESEGTGVDEGHDDNGHGGNGASESKYQQKIQSSTPLRRASVSLRQALSSPSPSSVVQQRKPFQSVQEEDYNNDDNDNENHEERVGIRGGRGGAGGGGGGGGKTRTPFSNFHSTSSPTTSPSPFSHSSPYHGSDFHDNENSIIGLTKHEIDRKMLFKKSESDRLQLIEENRRLRNEISQVTTKVYERIDDNGYGPSTDNLTHVVNELNGWDIERDELDAQIDRLIAQKEELIQKLVSTSRGAKFKQHQSQDHDRL